MGVMSSTFPILPLRDIVVFPNRIVPLFVGRDKSVAALETAMAEDKQLFLVAQLDPNEDDPDRDSLYDLGVVATAASGNTRVDTAAITRKKPANAIRAR